MRFKAGVNLALSKNMAKALPGIDQAHRDSGMPRLAYITSADDGKHMGNSFHYSGDAVDLRTRDLTAGQVQGLALALRKNLNGSFTNNRPYQVVIEIDHIHLEYDPL
jgi:hypothetical protein